MPFKLKILYIQTPKALDISFVTFRVGVVFPVSILFMLILDTHTFLPSLC